MKKTNVSKMVGIALLIAIVVVLQLLGQFIKFGPVSISLVLSMMPFPTRIPYLLKALTGRLLHPCRMDMLPWHGAGSGKAKSITSEYVSRHGATRGVFSLRLRLNAESSRHVPLLMEFLIFPLTVLKSMRPVCLMEIRDLF